MTYNRAFQEDDGNYSISGNPGLSLSRSELNKLMDLQGGNWFIVRNHDEPKEPKPAHWKTRTLDFNKAK
jgi:hypothetical protein